MVEVSAVGYVKAPDVAVMVRPGALVCLQVSAGRTIPIIARIRKTPVDWTGALKAYTKGNYSVPQIKQIKKNPG